MVWSGRQGEVGHPNRYHLRSSSAGLGAIPHHVPNHLGTRGAQSTAVRCFVWLRVASYARGGRGTSRTSRAEQAPRGHAQPNIQLKPHGRPRPGRIPCLLTEPGGIGLFHRDVPTWDLKRSR